MSVRNDIMEKVKELLCEVTGNPELSQTLTGSTDLINEIGLDSIQMINFVLMMEDEFGIEFDFEKFNYENFSNLNALCGFIGTTIDCTAAL